MAIQLQKITSVEEYKRLATFVFGTNYCAQRRKVVARLVAALKAHGFPKNIGFETLYVTSESDFILQKGLLQFYLKTVQVMCGHTYEQRAVYLSAEHGLRKLQKLQFLPENGEIKLGLGDRFELV